MLGIAPSPWRRLIEYAALEHRVDEAGRIVLRSRRQEDPALVTALVQSDGELFRVPLDELGFEWWRTENDDGWILRTQGPPVTMANVVARWGELAIAASDTHAVDERLLLATIACELGDVAPDANDEVKATRTDEGYPARAGDHDVGSPDRDLLDWRQAGGAHAAHGLMLTTIGAAHAAKPALFTSTDPAHYRTVLWKPVSALACGAALLASFPELVRTDPIAARVQYRTGSLTPTPESRWGVMLPDELALLSFIACWNDDAALRAGERLPVLASQATPEKDWKPLLLFGAATAVCTSIAWFVLREQKKRTSDDDDEDEDEDEDAA